MAGSAIPERKPIQDTFNGVVLQVGQSQALALVAPAGAQVIASGNLTIRYGIRYLGKPHLAIVPGLVALDYGEMLTGEDAWNFLLKRSTLYPRADVLGYRNDGADEMIVVKLLDLAEPIDVYVYPDAAATVPCAHPIALIAPADVGAPTRLLEYLPRYDSVDDWQAQMNHE
jgi:hypothetical protein